MSKVLSSLIVSAVLVTNLAAQVPSFEWPDGKKMAISLSFDDARQSHPTIAKDLFRELDLDVTFYVVPSGMQDNLEGWKEVVADGHEIGNHTIHHPCTGNFAWSRHKALEQYSLSTMRQELLDANAAIKEMLGVDPVSFAYTCGNTFVGRGSERMSYVPLIDEMFESGRGWLNEAPNDPSFTDMAILQGIEMDGKDFEADIKPMIEEAKESGNWLLLAGHEVNTDGQQTTRVAMLRALAQYVKEHADEIWIAPVGTIAQYLKETRRKQAKVLAESLTFCTTFDQGYEADFARGESSIYGAKNYESTKLATKGAVSAAIRLNESGLFGNALEFKRKVSDVIFYKAQDNVLYDPKNWNGTISFWLKVDPNVDLAPGYTDPVQITDMNYNDAAIWADFSDKNPRSFRMGVFGDLTVWNPDDIGPDKNPDFNNRLVPAEDLPFAKDKWTHVAISFSGLNSDAGTASFYINGELQGSRNIPEPFTLATEENRIFLGLNFVGLMDEVSIFDQSLNADEIKVLYNLAEGIQSVLDCK